MILDYIVVGAGPTGLLVHKELSKKENGIVIELGKFVKTKTENIYTEYQIKNSYRFSGLNIIFGKIPILLSEGSCVGGGSSVNSSIHHRTPAEIWTHWRDSYNLKGFDDKHISELYDEIEDLFDLSTNTSELPPFYDFASKRFKVDRLPRWGKETAKGFIRTTALDAVQKEFPNISDTIFSNHEVKDISYTKNKLYEIKGLIKNSKENRTFSFQCKKLFLCAGAGITPILLRDLGYKHNMLGKFQIHPTARITIIPKKKYDFHNIVEPFQITEFLPKLLLGSSANRDYLAQSNFPYVNHDEFDFIKYMNLYAMTPSQKRGRIYLSGILKGLRTYNLDKESEKNLDEGIFILYKLAKESNLFSHIYSPAGIINLENDSRKELEKFFRNTIKKTLCTVHIFSSAACGENQSICPIKSNGEVPGFSNLYVMDSSIIPSCPTVNPQATACIFALSLIRKHLN